MGLKEKLRAYTKTNCLFEKLWMILWWKKTKVNAAKYSDFEYAKMLWKRNTGKETDFSNPVTFNEKLWYLKLSNRDPLLTVCSDKHCVRDYVAKCGFADILKNEYACFNSADEIDFSKLPSPCYLKCNHASGMNFVFDKNKNMNIKHIKWKFNYLIKQNPFYLSREWNYKNIVPKIVCEEVLRMPDGISDIPEVQIFCFKGKPEFIMYNLGLADESGFHKKATRWVFDTNWNRLDIKTSMPTSKQVVEKPKGFDRMLEIATKLSQPFPHVRVDLFNIDGKIIFNEMTFYSGGGFVKLEPEIWQETFGDLIDCSNYTIAEDALVKHNKRG